LHRQSWRRGTILIDIYHRFTEGLGTADLKEAKNLLDELST
jgi:hypothetical protein